jgi:uncharacterized protein YdhG (YjbR/CyaY superfamily)
MKVKNVDAYIASSPKEVQNKLKEIRKAIREAAPDAIESISYQMPYYAKKGNLPWNKRSIVWFGLQSKHIGLYLPPPIVEEHKRELASYKTTKSAIHFPLNKKPPVALITKLIKARMKKNDEEKTEKEKHKKKKF